MYFSSVSSTAYGASGAWPSAAASPASMFAPNAFEATSWPSALSAEVISRVVVVLPLVPVTRTICRSAASSDSRPGSTRRPMTPPITDPSPRPARRDMRPAAPPSVVATRARIGSLPMADDAIRPAGRDGTRLVDGKPGGTPEGAGFPGCRPARPPAARPVRAPGEAGARTRSPVPVERLGRRPQVRRRRPGLAAAPGPAARRRPASWRAAAPARGPLPGWPAWPWAASGCRD